MAHLSIQLEVRPCHAAVARTLALRTESHTVGSTGGSSFSLSSWSRSIVPLDRAPTCDRFGFQTTAAICVYDSTGSAQDKTLNNRWPCVSCCGRMHVEQFTARYTLSSSLPAIRHASEDWKPNFLRVLTLALNRQQSIVFAYSLYFVSWSCSFSLMSFVLHYMTVFHVTE